MSEFFFQYISRKVTFLELSFYVSFMGDDDEGRKIVAVDRFPIK